MVLEIRGMFLQQWLILFTTACYGNLLGLNISAGMRNVVSIYILIPLILVPQLLLGGAMIKFDDLHRSLTNKEYVPVLGDLMATRWAYEAVMVEGFKSNKQNRYVFKYNLEIEQNNYYKDELIRNLRSEVIDFVLQRKGKDPEELIRQKLAILNYHVRQLARLSGQQAGNWTEWLTYENFNQRAADTVNRFFDKVRDYFVSENSRYFRLKLEAEKEMISRTGNIKPSELASVYNNSRLSDIVLNQYGILDERKYIVNRDHFVQKSTPVYMKPLSRYGRAHFFAPYKQIGNIRIDTLIFNTAAIWIMTAVFFITLYYNLLFRFIQNLEKQGFPFLRRFGRHLIEWQK